MPREPSEFEIEEVVQCRMCGYCHHDPNCRCPGCGAGIYWQCGPEEEEDRYACAVKAIQDRSRSNFKAALSEASPETLAWMVGQIEGIIKEAVS
jgi:hypothetical protein